MNICTRFIIVNRGTKILQMDKLLPRGVHGNLRAITLSAPLPLDYPCFSTAVFACSNLSLRTFSRTTDGYRSFLKTHNTFTESIMGKNPQGAEEVKEDKRREGYGKASGDYSNCGADDILPHILNIYGSCASPQDFDIYAPKSTFEDPLMRAEGVKQIKSAFYSLGKIFSESRIIEYSIKEDVISPGKKEISIDNKQYYKFLGKDIHMISLIKLQMENGKIVRHEDWWDKKPLRNRETVKMPLLGRTAEITRRASMLVTHALMGFGKDPTK